MDKENGSRTRVLVVDDEPKILKFVSLSLNALGFDVLVASNGEEALRISAADSLDLMILDVFMPGLDGFGVLERLREREKDDSSIHLPVIVFSARSSVAEQALSLGASDFILKPFLPEELAEKIKATVRRSP